MTRRIHSGGESIFQTPTKLPTYRNICRQNLKKSFFIYFLSFSSLSFYTNIKRKTMNDLIKKIVQENVWKQINKDFDEFILKHFEKLPHKEKRVFFKLISAEDEYSNLVMQNLWSEFSVKGCSEERMKELFVNEIKKFGSVKI